MIVNYFFISWQSLDVMKPNNLPSTTNITLALIGKLCHTLNSSGDLQYYEASLQPQVQQHRCVHVWVKLKRSFYHILKPFETGLPIDHWFLKSYGQSTLLYILHVAWTVSSDMKNSLKLHARLSISVSWGVPLGVSTIAPTMCLLLNTIINMLRVGGHGTFFLPNHGKLSWW